MQLGVDPDDFLEHVFVASTSDTLLFITSSFLLSSVTSAKLPFDPIKDFSTITKFDLTPNVLIAHPGFAPNTAKELIAYAKARPGQTNFGSIGIGTGALLDCAEAIEAQIVGGPGSVGGGVGYAMWKPQMNVHLQRIGAEGIHTTVMSELQWLDISARRHAEETLRVSEERHRSLFEKSHDALMTLAPPDWHYTAANSTTLAMFGARDQKDWQPAAHHAEDLCASYPPPLLVEACP